MFTVYDKNMNIKPFPKGVHPLDIYISSISKRRETTTIEGRSGIVTLGSTDDVRNIELEILLNAYDTQDYRLLRDTTYDYFSDEYFYVVENYQQGKRYKVTNVDLFIPERANFHTGSIRFNVETYDIAYAESIGTSQTIQNNGIDANDALWGFGMGLIADDESLIYTHTGTSFRIYNAGNVAVHPFQQELKITIDNVQGSTSYLQLRNITNGSVFRINEAVTNSQTIVIDRMNMSRNGLAIFRKTNRKYIELEPGWNEFEVTGATSARVAFDFRYYYK